MSVAEITQLASLYVPLAVPASSAGSRSSFQTAALLAAAVDTATLPLRCNGKYTLIWYVETADVAWFESHAWRTHTQCKTLLWFSEAFGGWGCVLAAAGDLILYDHVLAWFARTRLVSKQQQFVHSNMCFKLTRSAI
jgi:hypothetical protein